MITFFLEIQIPGLKNIKRCFFEDGSHPNRRPGLIYNMVKKSDPSLEGRLQAWLPRASPVNRTVVMNRRGGIV